MKIIIDRFNDKEKYEQSYDIDDKDIQGKTLLSFAFYQKNKRYYFKFYCFLSICNLWGLCSACEWHSYLACDTKMQDLLKEYDNPSSIRISPLGNFRVISDLIVDWEPSIENLRKIRPAMVAKNEFSAEKGCKQSQRI
ncbi:2Fe-2S iron-sulfur cluster-binding protein [Campylobacter jejuni]